MRFFAIKHIALVALIPFTFSFCKSKSEHQVEVQASDVDVTEEFVMSDSLELVDERSPYIIELTAKNVVNEEYDVDKLSIVRTDGVERDTIAVGCGGIADDEFAFAGNVQLDCKWLAILFPNVEGYNITEVRADIVDTKRYKEIEDYGRDVTVHTMDPKYNSADYDDDTPWDYDVAFKGDYTPSDFVYYPQGVVSSEDTLRIHELIVQHCKTQHPSYFSNPECNKIYLKELTSFNNDYYTALYFSETDDATYNYPHLFLIKGEKVLLWENSSFELQLHGFSLCGQDYIWTFSQNRHSIANEVYKLNDVNLDIIYSIVQTD